jgi:DNA-binding CsgD family transcriptional regulator
LQKPQKTLNPDGISMKETPKPLQSTNESNEMLQEINTLRRELNEYKQKLEETQLELSENNTALTVLAKNNDKIKFKTNLKILKKLHSQFLPLLKEIKSAKHLEEVQVIADEAIAKLQLFIPYPDNPYSTIAMLTPMEARIAFMIKDGFNSKDIAHLQFISMDTVKTHRGNIRKKLGLKNKQINLTSYLKSVLE